MPADTPVTIMAIHYPGGGFTELIATKTITIRPDSDSDGVPDATDACPDTVPGTGVDANGCPPIVFGDADGDSDVDNADRAAFDQCRSGPAVPALAGCAAAFDRDGDGDVDLDDFGILQRCYSGSCTPADPNCSN